jgi:hypothetical protein
MLIAAGADTTVMNKQTGNNILHLCLIHSKNLDIVNFLLKDVKIDIFARNKKDQTAQDIALAEDFKDAV